jgi:hypothetical protein
MREWRPCCTHAVSLTLSQNGEGKTASPQTVEASKCLLILSVLLSLSVIGSFTRRRREPMLRRPAIDPDQGAVR